MPSSNADDRWRERSNPAPRQVAVPEVVDDDVQEEVVGIGRVGSKAQLSVRFCFRDGTGKLFAYNQLYSVDFDGGSELGVAFTGHQVTITGWNLGRLLDYLGDHKARIVREGELNEVKFKAAEMGIESIVIEPLGQ